MGGEKLSPTGQVQSTNAEEKIELERWLLGALIVLINPGKKFPFLRTKLVDVSGKENEIFTESQSTSPQNTY